MNVYNSALYKSLDSQKVDEKVNLKLKLSKRVPVQ